MTKTFIALSSEIYDDKLVLLNTSAGKSLFNADGISTDEAIDFLWSIKHLKKGPNTVFVCYAFSRDNEFIFSGLPENLKDRLFQSATVRENIELLETEKERLESNYFNGAGRQRRKDVGNIGSLKEDITNLGKRIKNLKLVYYNGIKISLANGKVLTLNKNETSFSIYDIIGFFDKKPLYEMVKLFLNEDVPLLVRENFNDLPLMRMAHFEAIKEYSNLECNYIARLMEDVNNRLEASGIFLSRFHGASAITTWLLSTTKAKKEFHSYKKKRTLSPELDHAKSQAFYAARSEQLKVGYYENVNYYDLNGAYAHAATHLPKMLSKSIYQKEWSANKFSLWFVDYDLPKELYFGLLPYREIQGQRVRFKLRGRGYYWQPEVLFLLHYYPDRINIKGGFVLEYEKAEFTDGIENLYELRKNLKASGDPLSKVLKLSLASIYGKFCQHNGRSTYYNLFYAGFITSFVRAQLLLATHGRENETINFATDAIHTTANLDVELSDEMNGWKVQRAAYGKYLDNGIHQLYDKDDQIIKSATQGFKDFDFDKAWQEFENKQKFSGTQKFFIGHNMASASPLRHGPHYLKAHEETGELSPLYGQLRQWPVIDLELQRKQINSKVIDTFNGLPSGIYQHSNVRDVDVSTDTILAGRI